MIVKKRRINNQYLNQFDKLKEELAKMKPGDYEVYICNAKSAKTIQQLRYFFGVVCKTLGDSLGYETDEIYLYICARFIPAYYSDPVTNEVEKTAGSVRNLNTEEMTQLIDRVRRWAQLDMGIRIPDPNELTNDELVEMENKGLLR